MPKRSRTSTPRRPKEGQSLADTLPQLAKQWHPRRNGTLTPKDVMKGCHLRVWWICLNALACCAHEWEASVYNRATLGNGCPVCAHQRTCPTHTSIDALRPDLAAQLHPTRNGELTRFNLAVNSSKKILWWICA